MIYGCDGEGSYLCSTAAHHVLGTAEREEICVTGSHVTAPGEVGRFDVTKAESKSKSNKRLRIALGDA